MSEKLQSELNSHLIALAWDDQTSFDMIKRETSFSEPEVKAMMRETLKPGSYRTWRKRVSGRKMKHTSKLRTAKTALHFDDPASIDP